MRCESSRINNTTKICYIGTLTYIFSFSLCFFCRFLSGLLCNDIIKCNLFCFCPHLTSAASTETAVFHSKNIKSSAKKEQQFSALFSRIIIWVSVEIEQLQHFFIAHWRRLLANGVSHTFSTRFEVLMTWTSIQCCCFSLIVFRAVCAAFHLNLELMSGDEHSKWRKSFRIKWNYGHHRVIHESIWDGNNDKHSTFYLISGNLQNWS